MSTRLGGCDAVGARARVRGAPSIENAGRIEIGDDFEMSSMPAVSHLVTGPRGRLEIGDRVVIGHGAAIAAHARIVVGDDVRLGPYVMLLDTDFHVVGDLHRAPEPRPVTIGSNVRVGARVTILPGTVIGDGAVIAAGSVVRRSVDAGAYVAGVPARAVERGGFAPTGDPRRVPELARAALGAPRGRTADEMPADAWARASDALAAVLEAELDVRLAPEVLASITSTSALRAAVDRAQAEPVRRAASR